MDIIRRLLIGLMEVDPRTGNVKTYSVKQMRVQCLHCKKITRVENFTVEPKRKSKLSSKRGHKNQSKA